MTNAITAPQPLYSGTTSTSRSETAADRAALSSDFETFLKMLTVQVQNQDPQNPVDSTDYATQLATFTSVEQQEKTNDLLRIMAEQIGGGELQQVSQWIGREALVRAPIYFDQTGPVSLRPDYADGADAAVLVVRDEAGTVLERFSLDVGQDAAYWAGADETGALYPEGIYRFEIESYADDVLIDTRVAAAYSRIDEVRSEGGDILVRLADGTELPSSMISGLRSAG